VGTFSDRSEQDGSHTSSAPGVLWDR